jgi:hypothetical protein
MAKPPPKAISSVRRLARSAIYSWRHHSGASSLPQCGPQVFGANLKCSESSRGSGLPAQWFTSPPQCHLQAARSHSLRPPHASTALASKGGLIRCTVPGSNSKPFGNHAHTGPPRSRQGLMDSFFECGGNWGPPEALSFTSGPRKPGTDSFCIARAAVRRPGSGSMTCISSISGTNSVCCGTAPQGLTVPG